MNAIAARSLACLAAIAIASCAAPPAREASPSAAAAPAAKESEAPAPSGSLADLAWLAGCWRGSVNQREFREHWLPLRGDLLVGAGHTVNAGRTQDFEYLRIEPRADGVYYVNGSSGKESTFRLAGRTTDGDDTIFTFANVAPAFPQTIIYRRGSGGWLYVHVEGKVGGEERRVIYPFRRVDCESGEFILNDSPRQARAP